MAEEKVLDSKSSYLRQNALLISIWLAIGLVFFLLRAVLLPFILAILIAYVLFPLIKRVENLKIFNKKISRVSAVIVIYVALAVLTAVVSTIFLPQFYAEAVRLFKEVSSFINSLDDARIKEYSAILEEFFRSYHLPLEIAVPASDDLTIDPLPERQNLLSIDLVKLFHSVVNDSIFYIKSETKNIILSAQYYINEFVSFMFMFLLVVMITGFILVDVDRIKRFVFSLVPAQNRSNFAVFLDRLDTRLAGVVRGQLTICLVNAILTLIGLVVLNIKFAVVLASIAGIFSVVPIFGSIVSTGPIVLVALTQSPVLGLLALIWIVAIHILEANFLNPKIMGNSANIHPVLILLSLLAGKHFYGIAGALLSVPIMSIIVTIFSFILAKTKASNQALANQIEDDKITAKEV
jgi:predicted PurR-regulated permease PerM